MEQVPRQDSQESMRVLARRYGINAKTVAKRKKRESAADRQDSRLMSSLTA